MARFGLLNRFVFAGMLSLVICGCLSTAHATERETLILQSNDRNWPITDVTINGHHTSALLDTGATIALINDQYLPADGITEAPLTTRVLGIGGQRLYPVAQVNAMTAGAQSWSDLRVAVNTVDEFPVQQNILPVTILGSSIVDFDFPNAQVTLYDGVPQFVRGAHRSAISYVERDGLIYIPIRINGVRGRALIDTGASVSFVNPTYAERAKGKRRIEAEQDLQGSDLERNRVKIFNFRYLRFGDNRISRFAVPVLETQMFSDLGFEDEPMMVLGMDLLEHFRLQIDLKRKRLVLLR